ncbi:unnamed protein product [Symbiodinium natans]|uniref:Uncharacterized protein n=1 Tax=Symbiodinium natans TaxID=878477 RepID=A0A812MLE0_9DINO|nr:unnamed protein product [Symbiodinium natans]
MSRSSPTQIIQLRPTHASLKQMKSNVLLIQLLKGLELSLEIRFPGLTPFSQEFRRSTYRSLQDLNIASSINTNAQGLKCTDIAPESIPGKKIKGAITEIVSQTVFLRKTKLLPKQPQHFVDSSSTKPIIRVFRGKENVTPNICLSLLNQSLSGKTEQRHHHGAPLLTTRTSSHLAIINQIGRSPVAPLSESSRRRSVPPTFVQKNFRKNFIKSVLNILLQENTRCISPTTTNPISRGVHQSFSSPGDTNCHLMWQQPITDCGCIKSEGALEYKLAEYVSHDNGPGVLSQRNGFALFIHFTDAHKSAPSQPWLQRSRDICIDEDLQELLKNWEKRRFK